MDCLTVRENINAYIDRELSEMESRSVVAHIESCKSCKHEYDAYSLTRAFIADHSPAPSPPGLSESIRIMMEKERLIPKRRFFPRIKRTNTLLAASIALAVVTGAALMNTIDFKLPSPRGGAEEPQTIVITKTVPAPADKQAVEPFSAVNARKDRASQAKVIVAPQADAGVEAAAKPEVDVKAVSAGQKQEAAPEAPRQAAKVTDQLAAKPVTKTRPTERAYENVARRAVADKREAGAIGKGSGAGSGTAQARKPASKSMIAPAGVTADGMISTAVITKGGLASKDIPVVAEEKKSDAPAAPAPPAVKAKKEPRPGRINVPLPTIAQYPQIGGQQRNFVTPEQMLAMTSNSAGAMTEDYLFAADRAKSADSAPRSEAVSASTGGSLSHDTDLMGGYYVGYGSASAAAAQPTSDTAAAPGSKSVAAKESAKSANKEKAGEGASKKVKSVKSAKQEDKPVTAATTTKSAKTAKPPLNMTVRVRVKDPIKARALAIKNITAKGGTVVEKDGKIIMSMPASDTLANLKSVKAGAGAESHITVPEKLLNNESMDPSPRTVNTEIIFVTDEKPQ